MEIGDLIRTRRRELRLTQAKLAHACGVSAGCVGLWEASEEVKRVPSERNRRVLAQVLQLPIGALIEGAKPATHDSDLTELGDPKEAALLRLFRAMSPRQQEVHLSLFYISAGVRDPLEQEASTGQRPRSFVS